MYVLNYLVGNLYKQVHYEISEYKEPNVSFGYAEMKIIGNLLYIYIAGVHIDNIIAKGDIKILTLPVKVLGVQHFIMHQEQGGIIEHNRLLRMQNNSVFLVVNDLTTVIENKLSLGGCVSAVMPINK